MSAPKNVSNIGITFSMVAPSDSFERVGKIPTPAYIWVERGGSNPVTSVQVLFDDEPTPDGYERLEHDLHKNINNQKCYLAISRDGDDPIADISVITEEDPVLEGFERVDKDISRAESGSLKHFLIYKTKSAYQVKKKKEYQVGEYIDVLDTVNKWCVGRVAEINGDEIYIHYEGWSDKWNEWMKINTKRLAIYRTHTRGKDTGPAENDRAFKLSGGNLTEFNEHLETVESLLKKKELTKEEKAFLSIDNGKWVMNVLRAVIEDPENVPRAVGFLQMNLRLIVKMLKAKDDLDPGLLDSLIRIFDGDVRCHRFYSKYGLDKVKNKPKDGKFARKPNTTDSWGKPLVVSSYVIDNVNYFGEIGGFDAIGVRFNSDQLPTSFHTIRQLVRSVAHVIEYLVPDFLTELVDSITDQVFQRMRNISEEELKTMDRDGLTEVIKHMELLMVRVQQPNVAQYIEMFNLDISLRLLNTKLLEKRINGIQELRGLVDKVLRKENMHISSHAASHRREGAKYLTSKIVLEWIEKNNVIQILLGPSSHLEIIKRTPPILKFLAAHDKLTKQHLDTLWTSSIDKHESVVRVVYDAIADLASELSGEHLDFIFSRLSAMPLEVHNEISLQFLKSFTMNAVVHADETDSNYYGLDIFWKLLQDGVHSQHNVVELAFETLCDLLKYNEFQPQKLHYIETCVANLRDGRSVPQALRVCMRLIETFPSSHHSKAKERLITDLESKSGVLDLLLKDITRYSDACTAAMAERKDDSVNEEVVLAGYPHGKAIDIRLEFLDYILSRSDLTLSQEQVSLLWRAFVAKSILPTDASKFMNWLANALDQAHSHEMIDEEVATFIFTDLLCSPVELNVETLSRHGYSCFQIYFMFVNQANETLDIGPRNRKLQVLDFSRLTGLDTLWSIAVTAQTDEVSEAAGHFLINLHVNLEATLDALNVYENFINKAMGLIRESLTVLQGNKEAAHHSRHIVRLVRIIDAFLTQIEQKDHDDQDMPAHRSSQTKLQVTVMNKDGSIVTEIAVKLSRQNLIGDMRKELSRHIDWPAEQLKFVYRNRVLYPDEYDKMTIYQARIRGTDGRNTDKIMAYKMNPEDDLTRTTDDASPAVYPRLLLVNEQKNFDLLFDCLRLGDVVGQYVWRLLSRLPTNQQLADNINDLSPRDENNKPIWDQILDPSATLKLFYSLEIVDTLVHYRETDSELQKREVDKWCEGFIANGGLEHIYKVFVGMDLDAIFSGSLTQQCMALTLRLLDFFFQGRFAQIARQLSASFMDPSSYSQLLTSILARVVLEAPEDDGSENAFTTSTEVTQQVFRNLISAFQHDEALLKQFLSFENLETMLKHGLISHKAAKVRIAFSEGVLGICKVFQGLEEHNPRHALLPKLLDLLTHVQQEQCNEYFFVTSQLLASADAANLPFDHAKLSTYVASQIKEHPIIEVRSSDKDPKLRGLLSLMRELVRKKPETKEQLGVKEGLIEAVFVDCLFALPRPMQRGILPPKCKSSDLRKSAFSLLSELSRDCEANFRALVKLMIPNHMQTHSNGKNPREWEFEAKAEEKSITGYVGLKNLGCICYMNALIQQMFMIPSLRKNILSVPDNDEDRSESFLFQLQTIFAFLQESERMYCDPSGFCNAFKDWEGNPTNVHVQMDSQEFLNMLFDRIDEKAKKSPQERVLKSVLGGVFSNELICKGCPHYKEREEDFYAISLNVKNKKTLAESLDDFIQGEMLEGDNAYLCGKCNKKVDTLKRVCLKRLPATMVFHLKRFEFNFDTMQKVKLNDRLEFPERVNMKPYCKESLSDGRPKENMEESADGKDAEGKDAPEEVVHPDEYYEYELAGVLVHKGSADRGHYYSFIKERVSDNELRKGVTARWMEFNDTIISPFDPKNIPDECFGGEEIRRANYYNSPLGFRQNQTGGPTVVAEKYRNAYLLFYDRVRKVPEEEQEAKKPVALLRQRSASQFVDVPTPIFDGIWQENIAYWRDKNVYDKTYFQFVWDVCSHAKISESKQLEEPADAEDSTQLVTELSTRFVFETISRARDKDAFNKWLVLLRKLYLLNVPANAWFLTTLMEEKLSWLYDFLFQCTINDVRRQIASLMCQVLDTVVGVETVALESGTANPDLFSTRFIDVLFSMLKDAPVHWKRFEQFFRILAHFAKSGPHQAGYLIKQGAIAKLVDFYLGDASPHPEVGVIPTDSRGRRRIMGDDWGNKPDFSYFLSLMEKLVCNCRTPTSEKSTPSTLLCPPDRASRPSPVDVQMLTSRKFLSSLLTESTMRKRGHAVSRIICHWSWENLEFSESIIGFISAGIEEKSVDEIRPYFRTSMALVALQDSLQEKRVHQLMSSLLAVMGLQKKFWKITHLCIEHLIRMAKKHEVCYKWMHSHKDKFKWLIEYVNNHARAPGHGEDMQVYKPQRQHGYREQPYVSYSAMTAQQKATALQRIKSGKSLDEDINASDSDEELGDRVFQVGQWVDAEDTIKAWCRATIAEIQGDEVKLHYDGWAAKWDEWVPKASSRIARFGQHTRYIDPTKLKGTGPKPGDNIGGGKKYDPAEWQHER